MFLLEEVFPLRRESLSTPELLYNYFVENGVDREAAELLKGEGVDCGTLVDVTEDDLKELHIKLGPRKRIIQLKKEILRKKQNEIPITISDVITKTEIEELEVIFPERLESRTENKVTDVTKLQSPSCTPTHHQVASPSCTPTHHQVASPSCTPTRHQVASPSCTVPSVIPVTLSDVISQAGIQEHEIILPERFITRAENQVTDIRKAPRVQPSATVLDAKDIKIREWTHSHPMGERLIQTLDHGIYVPQDRRLLMRIICGKLIELCGNSYPSSKLKDQVAREIVKTFPFLKSTRGEGHEIFYNLNTGMGFIEFTLKTMRKKLPPSEKRYVTKSRCQKVSGPVKDLKRKKLESSFLSPEDLEVKVMWMKYKRPTDFNKSGITAKLKETMMNRQKEIKESNMTITEILNKYPRLKDYEGEMIDIEFRELYPGGDRFLAIFESYYVPRIINYISRKKPELLAVLSAYDDNLKSLFVLPELLPKATYARGKRIKRVGAPSHREKCLLPKQRTIPSPALIKFVSAQDLAKVASSDTDYVEQPHIVCAQYGKDGVVQYYIKIDRSVISISENPLRAFDILFKSHFVLNISYAKELDYFYNFIESCIYEITPPHASSESLNTVLVNMPVEVDIMMP